MSVIYHVLMLPVIILIIIITVRSTSVWLRASGDIAGRSISVALAELMFAPSGLIKLRRRVNFVSSKHWQQSSVNDAFVFSFFLFLFLFISDDCLAWLSLCLLCSCADVRRVSLNSYQLNSLWKCVCVFISVWMEDGETQFAFLFLSPENIFAILLIQILALLALQLYFELIWSVYIMFYIQWPPPSKSTS